MSKFTRPALGVLLAVPLLLAGCEEMKCDPCEGEACASFLGEYYGTIESLNETCGDVMLITGDDYMKVISHTPLELESRDSRGLWGVFRGTLCNTTDDEDPYNYFFTTYDTPDTSGADYTVTYSLTGFFTAGYQVEETVYPASVTATLDLRFVFDDGEICTLTGDIRGTQANLP